MSMLELTLRSRLCRQSMYAYIVKMLKQPTPLGLSRQFTHDVTSECASYHLIQLLFTGTFFVNCHSVPFWTLSIFDEKTAQCGL